MAPRSFFQRWSFGLAFLACALAAVSSARAQQQEGGTLARVKLDRPANAQSFEFAGAGKSFGTSAAVGGKQAQVKSFNFDSKISVLGGSGAFQSKTFNPRTGGFRTEAYTTKASQLSQRNSFVQGDKSFGTKPMDVREAPAANRSAATRAFVIPAKPYEWHGKRQGALDEIYKASPNLTIDQVRDLLNKGPAGRP